MHWALLLAILAVAYVAFTWFRHRYVWRSFTLGRKTYANGMTAWHVIGDSTNALVYRELFEEECYFKNGITWESLQNSSSPPLIVDVGTNVGLFAVSLARKLKAYDIQCFEPVPLLCEAAERNVRPFNKGTPTQRVTVNRFGLASAEATVTFDVEYSSTAGATMFRDDILSPGHGKPVMAWAQAAMHDAEYMQTLPVPVARTLYRLLKVPVLQYFILAVAVPLALLPWFIWLATAPASRRAKVRCQLRRLSDAVPNDGRPIALLKVDVEGAEWTVLQGIDDDTWARVQQCVIEVHNIDGRVAKVMQLLRDKGFRNVTKGVESLLLHEVLQLETVFATRT